MAQFILKDSKGKEQTFDHETIYVRDTNGELVQFTQGEGDIPAVVQPLEVTENGTYTAPDGVDGYSPVTVNVAGSGGGLPAGVYLSAPDAPVINKYRQRRFVFNGVLYATAYKGTGEGYICYIYKWDGSAWTTLLSDTTSSYGIGNAYIDCVSWQAVEYNGKMHFFSGKYHAVFDGTTFTAKNALPNLFVSVCVYQNKLYAYINNTGTIYEWDEGTDAWNTVVQLSTGSWDYYYMYVINDQLYVIKSKNVYLYNKGALEQIATLSYSPTASKSFRHKNKLYYLQDYSSATYGYFSKVYRFDPITKTEECIGDIPRFSNIYFTLSNDEISFTGTTASTSDYYSLFVMTIVESTE